MSERAVSRRECLRLVVIGSAAVGSAGLWIGCSKEEQQQESAEPSLSCTDVSGLSEADKATRNAMQYVDASPHPDKQCANCNLFKPASQPNTCGECTIVKGPINPEGYCTAWVRAA